MRSQDPGANPRSFRVLWERRLFHACSRDLQVAFSKPGLETSLGAVPMQAMLLSLPEESPPSPKEPRQAMQSLLQSTAVGPHTLASPARVPDEGAAAATPASFCIAPASGSDTVSNLQY